MQKSHIFHPQNVHICACVNNVFTPCKLVSLHPVNNVFTPRKLVSLHPVNMHFFEREESHHYCFYIKYFKVLYRSDASLSTVEHSFKYQKMMKKRLNASPFSHLKSAIFPLFSCNFTLVLLMSYSQVHQLDVVSSLLHKMIIFDTIQGNVKLTIKG